MAENPDRPGRPLGITLLTLYAGSWGLLAVIMTLPALILAAVTDLRLFHPSEAVTLQALSLFLPMIGVLNFALVYGLWTRQQWAHPLAITLFIAGPCLGLVLGWAAPQGPAQTLTTFGECGVAVAALFYLLADRTRTYFGLDT
jgi:hypothetical protein